MKMKVRDCCYYYYYYYYYLDFYHIVILLFCHFYSITSSSPLPNVCKFCFSLGPKISVFGTNVEGVNKVTYFLNCKKLLLGIDSIESLIFFVMFSEGTTITNLSTIFIILFIIISFTRDLE